MNNPPLLAFASMKLFLAQWPNGDMTIVPAEDSIDLFDRLDDEGDPSQTSILPLTPKDSHTALEIVPVDGMDDATIRAFHLSGPNGGRTPKWRTGSEIFNENIYRKWLVGED